MAFELLSQQRELGVVVVVLLFRFRRRALIICRRRAARAPRARSAAGRAAALSKPSRVFASGDPLRVGFALRDDVCFHRGPVRRGGEGRALHFLGVGAARGRRSCVLETVGLLRSAKFFAQRGASRSNAFIREN